MFNKTPKKIAEFVINYRWPILIFNALIFAALLYFMGGRVDRFNGHVEYMSHIRNNPLDKNSAHVNPPPIFDADYQVYFEDDNPELIAYHEFQEDFSKDENLIIVVKSHSGDIFTNENLKSIKELSDRSWSIPYVFRVDGISNFNYTIAEDDDLLVEDFIDELPLSNEELLEKKETALADPLMPHFLLSKKADLTQIQLRVIIPKSFPVGYLEAREALEAVVRDVKSNNPDLDVRLGGTVMLNTAFSQIAEADMTNLMPIMFLFIIIILTILIRSFWGTTLPMLLLLASVAFPILLFVGGFEFSLNNSSINVMQMLIAVAIADAVHVMSIFYRGLRNGLNKLDAVRFSVEKNFLPCLITSITTGIGFYALVLQTIPPFKDLGLFAGTGTLFAFWASLFVLPAFLTLLPFKQRESKKNDVEKYESKGYEGLTNFIFKYQKSIRRISLLTTLIAIYFLTTIKVDNIAYKYFAPHTEFRQATEYIDQNILGVNPVEFSFDSGEENGVYSPEYLKKLEKFQNYLMNTPEYEVTYASSVVDIVKRINKTMHGDDPAYYKIPEENEVTAEGDTIDAKRLIAQYFLLYQMSLPQGMELTNQIDLRNQKTRVTAFTRSVSSDVLLKNYDKVNEWIQKEMPETKALALGVPIMFSRLMMFAIPGMLQSLGISFLLITIVLMITFKSVRIGLFSMIPNVWPMILVFGGIGLFGVTVNLAVAVIGMITLGICVDDTVHFLTKYLRAEAEGKNQRDAILYSFRQVAAPLMFTSIILVAGFGALISSDFVVNSDMALYCSIVIVFALFADFLLLPATILKFEKPAKKLN
jgi:hypothetical protein